MTNAEIINATLGADYADRIPTATKANFADVGAQILAYEPAKNQFLDALLNKIGLTLVAKLEFDNPFSRYKGVAIPYGDTIEDIYVGIEKGYEYDMNNEDPFGQKKPTITVLYHTINVELQYKTTINDSMLRRAFKSANGLSTLINDIVASLKESADYDEYLATVRLLSSDSILGTTVYMGAKSGNDNTDAKTLTKAIKDVASQMRFMGKKFNKSGVNAQTPFGNQLLVIRADMKNDIDIDFLAGLFNMTKAEITSRIIEVSEFFNNDGTEDTSKVAVLVDERGFKIHQALVDGGMIYNPQGKYTNHFYNNWEIVSWSLYRNAVAFKFAADPTVSS